MPPRLNQLGQPIGFAVPDWVAPPRPSRETLIGRFGRVEPLDSQRHAAELFAAYQHDTENRLWTYLPYGPFDSFQTYDDWLQRVSAGNDPFFYAFVDTQGKALGAASYLRIQPSDGSIEVGHVAYSPLLQRTPLATEAMYLLMKQVFTLGYRRYEWKCDALNAGSRAAAQRLGFSFEGVFQQVTIYKGRNRDTAWFSITDREWPALQRAFEAWLDAGNFDDTGAQRTSLSSLTKPLLRQEPPR